MSNDFHIGNRKSRIVISDPGMPLFRCGNYNGDMTSDIGTKRPARLYIRQWLKQMRLDQKDVAELMGVEPGTLSKLLSGKMDMTTDYLGRIADALNLSVKQLFKDPAAPFSADDLTDEDLKVAEAFSQLAASDKETVLQLAARLRRPSPDAQ